MANTIEPFMCGGDGAFCQITLTSFVYVHIVYASLLNFSQNQRLRYGG